MIMQLLFKHRNGFIISLERFGRRDGMLVTEGIVHVDVVLHAGTDHLEDISGFMYWVD
jgi:hypothetical protein